MVGTGSEQQQRLRSRLGDFPVVHFTAWLPREEAYRLARSCHLGWLPLAQGNDGFLPNKPFEYSALGLAQVVGKASEVGRLVREHDLGIEYDQKRPDDLVESLRELSFEKISAWQSNATVFWREKGDAKECAAGFAEHLERIATDTTV